MLKGNNWSDSQRNLVLCTKFILVIFLNTFLLNGCGWHKTFKQNDRQGQLLPEKAISQLKTGMSPAEINNIMGSPVLYNLNDNRWEYIEYSKVKGETKKNLHLILTFKDSVLTKIERF